MARPTEEVRGIHLGGRRRKSLALPQHGMQPKQWLGWVPRGRKTPQGETATGTGSDKWWDKPEPRLRSPSRILQYQGVTLHDQLRINMDVERREWSGIRSPQNRPLTRCPTATQTSSSKAEVRCSNPGGSATKQTDS